MSELRGARSLVTGAARGMGKLFAERLLRRGGQVAMADVDAEGLEAAAAELRGLGMLTTHVGNLATAEDPYRIVAEAEAALGGLDLVVNNAGVVTGGPLTEVSDARHQLTMDVNVMGVVRTTRAALPGLIARQRGHILNLASAASLTGVALQTTYCASKWAVLGFSEALRYELMQLYPKAPIHVTAVCPSFVDTGMFDGASPPRLVPMLKPETVVDRALRAVEKDARTIMLPATIRGVPVLRVLLPDRLVDFFSDKLGVNRAMQGWRGH